MNMAAKPLFLQTVLPVCFVNQHKVVGWDAAGTLIVQVGEVGVIDPPVFRHRKDAYEWGMKTYGYRERFTIHPVPNPLPIRKPEKGMVL